METSCQTAGWRQSYDTLAELLVCNMAEQAARHWTPAVAVLLLCSSAASERNGNCYEILGVEPAATDSQIKKAFRELAMKYHPDKNKSADAEKTFREIAEAYSVLSDKKRRRLYDSVGHDAFLRNKDSVDLETEDATSFHFSFSDFFPDLEDSVFTEESHFHWSFGQVWEDEDMLYEHYSFDEPDFSLYFTDDDENEEVHHY